MALSDVDDSAGLTNTTLGAMVGMMAGPFGAAVGGGIGLLLDFRSAGDQVEDSLGRVDAALGRGAVGFDQARNELSSTRNEILGLQASLKEPISWDKITDTNFTQGWAEMIQHFGDFSNMYQDEIDAINAKSDELVKAEDALYNVGRILGQDFQRNPNGSIAFAMEDLVAVADRAAPAMRDLGITLEDLKNMSWGDQMAAAAAIRDWLVEADSAEGRTKQLAAAFKGLRDDMIPTAEAAMTLAEALDAILGPELNVSEATDAWTVALRSLRNELAEKTKTLEGNSGAAIKNREAIRGRVTDLRNLLVAEAEAGAGAGRLARILQNQRRALLDAGEAAGMSRKQLNAFLNELGLTPKMVTTVFKMLGIDKAELETRRLTAAYKSLPKNVRTELRAEGIPKTKGDLEELQRKYKLTPAQVKTIAVLMDAAAKRGITTIQGLLNRLDGTTATPKVSAAVEAARAAISSVSSLLAGLNGRTATTYVRTVRIGPGGQAGGYSPSAYGNFFPTVRYNAFGDYANGHQPEMTRRGVTRVWNEPETMGESYIPHANDGRRPRAKEILEETAGLFGGTVFYFASGGHSGGSPGRRGGNDGPDGVSKALKRLRDRIKDVTKELEKETEQRRNLRERIKQYRSEVAGSFDHDPFGNGVAGLDLQLKADRNDARAMKQALIQARKKGLDGGLFAALAASGDLNTAQQMAGLSRKEIEQRERLWRQTQRAQNNLGEFAANKRFGETLRDSNKAVRELRQELRELRRKLPKSVEDGARRGVGDRNRNAGQRSRVGR